MDDHSEANDAAKRRRPRATQNIELTDEQLQALINIWKEYRGRNAAFAKKMAQVENPGEAAAEKAIEAKRKALLRIEHGDTGVSEKVFQTIADVLGITTTKLIRKISPPAPKNAVINLFGPWINDEKLLSEYRTIFHGYYLTRQDDDYFWMHHEIDFTTPHEGCLHTTMNYGIDKPIHYKVYGYLFRQMLVVISKSEEERQPESVGIYYDFRRKTREHRGHFGILLTEDWNQYFGVGGSMLLRKPIPGTEKEGRQTAAACKKLTEYWKKLDGERCNRLLYLFGFGPFSRSKSGSNESRRKTS
jgi:hypothetical protein